MIRVKEALSPAERAESYATRHGLFCEGGAGQKFELCGAPRPDAPHDYDTDQTILITGFYDNRPVAAARVLIGPDLPTADQVFRRLGWPLPPDLDQWAEPSRVGLEKQLQMTRIGREVILRMVGVIIDSSLQRGCGRWLLTMREALFRSLRWFPFELGPPLRYTGEAGGPDTAEPEPIFSTTLSVPETVLATWHLKPAEYALMFPQRPDLAAWGELLDIAGWCRPATWLSHLAVRNMAAVQQYRRDWNMGKNIFPEVGA